MSQQIIQPSTATRTALKPGYNPSLGPIQLPSSYTSQVSKAKTIYDNSLSRRTPEVNIASLSFLFSGIVQYVQSSSKGVKELEAKLNALGYGVGTKFLELITLRDGKNAKRETKVIEILQFIHTQLWKTLFGKVADELEKSSDSDQEYMITDNLPLISQFISVPKEFGQLNVGAFTAGIIEGILDAAYFQAEVSAHTVEQEGFPLRTVFLVKFDRAVIEREAVRFSK
ncbi:Transport protein particle subunit trs31 Short=TRAPP subunit trs31 [Cyberlindnera jadinii]|uniref:Trafficking protein particle complex subunit n=2 Tax=Cyberlindnera jadinii (strain ATCC 18201 / CBS 1600 / BCRC 20928 / JCM 3617 / NBRC 0987 / NRRL Y-1542) TaxID=983966 RepID=A0A0H5C3U7_CYBJN|nr:Transport protein particle subunit trs31 Short=TRAPP subunit trs31 [Cyberlindnera jadinii]